MSINHPKNLEIDFNNLSINPSWKKTLAPNHSCVCKTNRKEYTFKNILAAPTCNCKTNKKRKRKLSIVRPAKLILPTNRKNSKLFVLKKPTLSAPDDKISTKSNTSKPTVFQTMPAVVSKIEGKVFCNEKPLSQSSFKSLLQNADTDISKAFDTLSFKELRNQSSKCLEKITSKQKHESSSSCSVQARMESSLPTDCDDTSIEELASYFDLFVHIPKKMSSMAEMMYI